MAASMNAVQRLLAVLVVAGVAIQFFLAGAGAFGATSYSPHKAVGYALTATALIALLVALLTRRLLLPSLLLVGALVVQVALGSLGTSSSNWFGAFHGLNALVVMGTAVNLARRTARLHRTSAGSDARAVASPGGTAPST
jgi:hypothetical protein